MYSVINSKSFNFLLTAEQGEKIENRCVLIWEVRSIYFCYRFSYIYKKKGGRGGTNFIIVFVVFSYTERQKNHMIRSQQ